MKWGKAKALANFGKLMERIIVLLMHEFYRV